jgi:hypothetical protein
MSHSHKTFVGFEVLTAMRIKNPIFWDMTPCSPLKLNRRFRGISRLRAANLALLAICLTLSLCLAYSPKMKMEAKYFSETLVVSGPYDFISEKNLHITFYVDSNYLLTKNSHMI